MVNGAKERGCRSGCRWDRVGQAEQPTAYTAHRMIHTRVIYCVQRVPPWAGDRLETCSLLTCLITYLHSDLGHGSGGGGGSFTVYCVWLSRMVLRKYGLTAWRTGVTRCIAEPRFPLLPTLYPGLLLFPPPPSPFHSLPAVFSPYRSSMYRHQQVR